MNDLEKFKLKRKAYHDYWMSRPKEELRAYLAQREQETIDGWLGISDWLLSEKPDKQLD